MKELRRELLLGEGEKAPEVKKHVGWRLPKRLY
jgi:hypothetical protein